MSEEMIRKHLRSALNEVLSTEKSRFHKFYDESDADIAARIKMMAPVHEALKALKVEAGDVNGLNISPAPHGHMATVKMKSSGSTQRLSISTSIGNSHFTIEEYLDYVFSAESFEKSYKLASAEDVLKLIVEAVGKHIAADQVLRERKQ